MTETISNQRKFSRYPMAGSPARVTFGVETFDATVFDESIGGLGVVVVGTPPLSIGNAVQIEFRGEKSDVYVRAAQRVEGNQARLGLSWDPPRPDEIPEAPEPLIEPDGISSSSTPTVIATDTVSFEIVEQVYYTHRSISVVCEAAGIAPTGEVKIVLSDGTKFLAECKKISTRTRSRRLMELEATEVRETLGRIYGVEPTLEAILEFEFS